MASRAPHGDLVFAPLSPCNLLRFVSMAFQLMPMARKHLQFDHPDWIFELKYDGFRSFAVIHNRRIQFISRLLLRIRSLDV